MIRCQSARRPSVAALAASLLLLFAAVPSSASGATLFDLFNGASIDAGNARFSDWQLAALDATAALSPNLTLINVTPLTNDPANPGLQFAGNGQLAISGLNAIDLAFSYRVQAINNGASFIGHALAITGVNFGGAGGLAFVSQNSVAQTGADLGAAVAIADHQNDLFQLNASTAHAPRLSATVNMNVFLQGLAATDTINLTTFTQRFAQTGPTTLVGDFNNNKTVDGADFLVWQRGGSPSPRSASDLALWRTNYGQSIAATPAVQAVPEPAMVAILLSGLLPFAARTRRSGKKRRLFDPLADIADDKHIARPFWLQSQARRPAAAASTNTPVSRPQRIHEKIPRRR